METLPVLYDETGLSVERVLTWAEAGDLAHTLGRIMRAEAWWWGDFLCHIEKVFPQTWPQLIPDDMNPDTLRNYKWVAERFPKRERVLGVSWSIHQIAAGIEDGAARARLLEQAGREKLTCTGFRDLIRGKKEKLGKELTCPECGHKWKV